MRGLWVSYGTHTGRTEKPSVRLERPVPIEYSRSKSASCQSKERLKAVDEYDICGVDNQYNVQRY